MKPAVIAGLVARIRRCHLDHLAARAERDKLIACAVRHGVPMAHIARAFEYDALTDRLSESAVRKITARDCPELRAERTATPTEQETAHADPN